MMEENNHNTRHSKSKEMSKRGMRTKQSRISERKDILEKNQVWKPKKTGAEGISDHEK